MTQNTRSHLLLLFSLSVILLAMSGCAHGLTAATPLNSYCAIARPITYDRLYDTNLTVAQLEAHNSQWACLCEKDCPATVVDTR